MPYKWLVLFDIDGTLLNSGGCGRAATRQALYEVFGTVGGLDGVDFAGKTDWQIMLEALGPAGISARHVKSLLDDHNLAVARHLTRIISDFPVQACEGAQELVAALKARSDTLLGLVTGNMQALAPLKLSAAGFDPEDFKVGAFGSEGWERAMLPPLALDRARAYNGSDFEPEQVIIIGDTPADVACAASIGARTIAVATGPFNTAQLREADPTYVFPTLADTEAVIGAIVDTSQQGRRPPRTRLHRSNEHSAR